jgi:hypothetical protein
MEIINEEKNINVLADTFTAINRPISYIFQNTCRDTNRYLTVTIMFKKIDALIHILSKVKW